MRTVGGGKPPFGNLFFFICSHLPILLLPPAAAVCCLFCCRCWPRFDHFGLGFLTGFSFYDFYHHYYWNQCRCCCYLMLVASVLYRFCCRFSTAVWFFTRFVYGSCFITHQCDSLFICLFTSFLYIVDIYYVRVCINYLFCSKVIFSLEIFGGSLLFIHFIDAYLPVHLVCFIWFPILTIFIVGRGLARTFLLRFIFNSISKGF